MQIFDTARRTTDVLANTKVENVFCTMSLNATLDLRSDCLKQLAEVASNTKLVCIWETESSDKFGFSSIFQTATGLEAAGVRERLDNLGECLLMSDLCLFNDMNLSCRGCVRATSEWQGSASDLH